MCIPLFLAAVLAGGAATVDVETVGGESANGTVTKLNGQELTLETPKGRVTLQIGKLTGITVKDPQAGNRPKAAVWLETIDGCSLAGTAFTVAQGRGRLVISADRTIEIPIADIAWVRFQPQTEAVARQWAHILEGDVKTDLLVVAKGDSIDYLKGVLGEISDETVQFELDGEKVPAKRARVHGLVYHRIAGRNLPEPLCTISEAAGATWAAESIAVADNEVEWTTPTGLKLKRPLATLARIDFSRGKVVYLGDLKADSVEWVPYFGLAKELPAQVAFFAPRMDRSLGSGPLQLEGHEYKKGIALHSRTTMVYRLPDKFQRFAAIAGIDDAVRPRGHVQLVIRGDDRELYRAAISGKDPPKPLDLDVKGVRRLVILVDFGEDLDVADHLDLCEAKLIK